MHSIRIGLLTLFTLAFVPLPALASLDWDSALRGEHRDPKNAARDGARHPRETLEFFGLEEGMRVVELAPGGGWYTEVLAPLMKGNGSYYAAHYGPNGQAYYRRALGAYLQKLGENDDVYGEVKVTVLASPMSTEIAPAGSADMVLAFRNVHSWMRAGTLAETMAASFTALKGGGVFGIVQHRTKDNRTQDAMKETGYVSEDVVIAAAEAAGFELAARSEVNANPKDTADHTKGVWELPPGLRGDAKDRAARIAVGESDRMTLKFVKPGA